jgi:hypothetical protein
VSDDQTLSTSEWFDAFPLPEAAKAASVLCQSWNFLITKSQAFHPKMSEPKLTKALKIHVEQVTAREAGLLGMWGAETVIGMMDLDTGAVTEERRTDISYGWNDTKNKLEVVFEFKKLTRLASSRKAYVGPDGLGRFVTGIYSEGQPVAAMVGILVDPYTKVVPPLIEALEEKSTATALQCVLEAGKVCRFPSTLFTQAEFDTAHERSAKLAPTGGVIRVAHLFLPF